MPAAEIVVIEDEQAIRRGVADALRASGYGGYSCLATGVTVPPLSTRFGRNIYEAAAYAVVGSSIDASRVLKPVGCDSMRI